MAIIREDIYLVDKLLYSYYYFYFYFIYKTYLWKTRGPSFQADWARKNPTYFFSQLEGNGFFICLLQCVSLDSPIFAIDPEIKATEVTFWSRKPCLSSLYFLIDNKLGGYKETHCIAGLFDQEDRDREKEQCHFSQHLDTFSFFLSI